MPKPQFFRGARGDCYGLLHKTLDNGGNRIGVLLLPPFADEMNKSRRMLARLLHRLAEHSVSGLLFDPYGTGDSAGDFSEASWDLWLADARIAARFLREQGVDELVVVALRSGALIARAVESDLQACGLRAMLLWHPVPSGKVMLNQFLRLRLAALMDQGGSRETGAMLRERLTAGEIVEVGGYGLSGDLAFGMEEVDLLDSELDPSVTVAWAELVSDAERPLLPASRKVIERWRQRGIDVRAETIVGPQFWSTAELADVPELIDWSLETILAMGGRPAA